MACQGRGIGKDHMIAYYAIVGHMDISHQQAVLSDNGLITGFCAAVHRNKFPDRGIIPDMNGCFFTVEFQVLRNG